MSAGSLIAESEGVIRGLFGVKREANIERGEKILCGDLDKNWKSWSWEFRDILLHL